MWELALASTVLAVAIGATLGLARARWRVATTAAAVAAVGIAALASRPPARPAARDPVSRDKPDALGYVGSAACKPCHAPEHASWARTFHHTMTRAPTPDALREPCAHVPARLTLDGRPTTLACDADGMTETTEGVSRKVLLVTGSHHYQVFWRAGAREGELAPLPFVWLREDRRFAPRRDVFVAPPGPELFDARWNSNCVQCHTTAPRPGRDTRRDAFATDAAELGVACEACHGPGAKHAERFKSPLARRAAREHPGAPRDITDPRRLSAERASMVCGQCHSVALPRDEPAWWTSGYVRSYEPGDDLRASRTMLTPSELAKPGAPRIDVPVDSMFFRDGVLRVTGRELHDVLASACHTRGAGERQLSCLSCHSMHRGAPDRQLTPGKEEDRACASCHDPSRYESATHSHHDAAARVSCVGCHMPRTTYGLLGAIRSHRIDVPRAEPSVRGGRMNACSLCHADRSLEWAAAALARFGKGAPAAPEKRGVSAVAWSALTGDAGARALGAAALGALEGRDAATERTWRAPILARLLSDPYAAVRYVARRSLANLGVVVDVAYDPSSPESSREPFVKALRAELSARGDRLPPHVALPRTLADTLDEQSLDEWQAARDDRPVVLAE